MIRFVIVAAAVLSASCAGNRAYRLGESLFRQGCCEPEFRLAFVEFDDRGEYHDRERKQLKGALKAIADAKAEARKLGIQAAVVVFIHGWKNNASDDSGNVWAFRDSLADIARTGRVCRGGVQKCEQKDSVQRPTVGIYIGWRGATLKVSGLNQLTYWERRNVAQSIANVHMSEALTALIWEAKGRDYSEPHLLVLLGHSFGGYVLERAVTPLLSEVVLKAEQTGEPQPAPANLVVFANEAAPALEAIQFLDILHQKGVRLVMKNGHSQEAHPLIVSVTSRGDIPTKLALPGGQAVSWLFALKFLNLRRGDVAGSGFDIHSQHGLYLKSTANTGKLRSHLIGLATDDFIQDPWKKAPPYLCFEVRSLSPGVRCPDTPPPTTPLPPSPMYAVIEDPNAKNKTPYWAAQMPTSIVPDHGNIFTPGFRAMLRALVLRREPDDAGKMLVGPPGAEAQMMQPLRQQPRIVVAK